MQTTITEQRERLTQAQTALLAQRADMTLAASAGDAEARKKVVVLRQQSIALEQEIADLAAAEVVQRRMAQEASDAAERQRVCDLVNAVPAHLQRKTEAAAALDVKVHEVRTLVQAYLDVSRDVDAAVDAAYAATGVEKPTFGMGAYEAERFTQRTFWKVGNVLGLRELFAHYSQMEVESSDITFTHKERVSPPKEIFAAEVDAKNASVLASLPKMKRN